MPRKKKKKKRPYQYYSAREIKKILKEYDKAPHGEKAAVAEKYGVTGQHIYAWRKRQS